MTNSYSSFLTRKSRSCGREPLEYKNQNPSLYDFQRDIVSRALAAGRYAIFADCGLGKTLIEMEWASNVPGQVLLLSPLAVGEQMEREAARFGFDAALVADQSECNGSQICITNYEKLHRFDPSSFAGVVLDESSILKAYTGKIRNQIIESFGRHRYRLAATATPAPNDFMELGNHSEFLGAMTRKEMLSMFFVHDGGSTQDWRIKGHAKRDYWRWIGSWACMIRSPYDLGYDGSGFELPELRVHHEKVDSNFSHHALIPGATALDLNERRRARRESIEQRTDRALSLDSGDQYLIWCDLNDESAAATKAIDGAVEVKGADSDAHKRKSLVGFSNRDVRVLVTKPSIGGWGMNWQECSRMAFMGLSDSYESFYQATRRCWRYGQKSPVDVFLIYSEPESVVVENVLRKESQHQTMQDALIAEVKIGGE